ncbi:MAG: type III pantothenate kinase [Fidelibacterota bacterium]|nr:MAG: type III pantothenate kinase [Candidatus Neomarinimicrobiota bacterium]
MLLAMDVGNSNVVLALFKDEELLESWRLHTNNTHTGDDWWIAVKHLAKDAGVDIGSVNGIIISSVVPVVGRALIQMCERYLQIRPMRVNAHLPLDLGLDVKDPDSVGADRICNVVAGRTLYGVPGIIVDLGTATTFDVVNESGHFIGGSIAPGMEASARRLFSGAALLSAVDLKVPGTAIGRDTETNLQAGIVYGVVDQIDGMITRIREETGWQDIKIVLTGGLGGLISDELRTSVTYDPDLTVKGLRLIYQQCS